MEIDRCIFLLSLPQGRLRGSDSCYVLKMAKLCLIRSVRTLAMCLQVLALPPLPPWDFLGRALPNIVLEVLLICKYSI